MKPAMDNTSNSELPVNIKAANCYFMFFISGFLILQNEKNNKFVRFHAFQSIYFSLFFLVSVLIINNLPFIGEVLSQLFTTVFFIVWIYLIYSAYSNRELKLPIIGDIAYTESRK